MEFMTGVKEKETLEFSELLEEGRLGEEVKVNGAVHTIRDMGTVAFVILRKREGLVQCVYEEGITKFDLKDLREEADNGNEHDDPAFYLAVGIAEKHDQAGNRNDYGTNLYRYAEQHP